MILIIGIFYFNPVINWSQNYHDSNHKNRKIFQKRDCDGFFLFRELVIQVFGRMESWRMVIIFIVLIIFSAFFIILILIVILVVIIIFPFILRVLFITVLFINFILISIYPSHSFYSLSIVFLSCFVIFKF